VPVGGRGTLDGGSRGRGTVDVWVTVRVGSGGLFDCRRLHPLPMDKRTLLGPEMGLGERLLRLV
jgi:hypothetical protein